MSRIFICLFLSIIGLSSAEDGRLLKHRRQEQINSFFDEICNATVRIDSAKVGSVLCEYANHVSGNCSEVAIQMTRNDILRIAHELTLLGNAPSLTNVLERLGAPTYSLPRSRKSNDYSRGICLKYYMFKRNLAYVDDRNDAYVSLYFDGKSILDHVVLSANLERLMKNADE